MEKPGYSLPRRQILEISLSAKRLVHVGIEIEIPQGNLRSSVVSQDS